MRHLVLVILITLFAALPRLGVCADGNILGGFEITGFLNVGAGFQHYSRDPITKNLNGGSAFGGSLGAVLPGVNGGPAPVPGEDYLLAFIDNLELDIVKSFGKRARLRADLYFARPLSGSAVGTTSVEHAYLAVTLSEKYGAELALGRIGLETGIEPYERYSLDTISESVLSNASMYPGPVTAMQLAFTPIDDVTLYLLAANGMTDDTLIRTTAIPSGIGIVEVNWGDPDQGNGIVITADVSPDSDANGHLTYGGNIDLYQYVLPNLQLSLEGLARRDNAIAGGVNTTYAAALGNLRWDITKRWYAVFKYAYAWQSAAGNGFYNLTGAHQQLHEAWIGFGHYLADTVKLKWEVRMDVTDPAVGATQWIASSAIGIGCAF